MQDAIQIGLEGLPHEIRRQCDLGILAQIASTICEARTLEELENRWLELIFQLTSANRIAVLLNGDGLDQPRALFGTDKAPRTGAASKVSRELIEQVLKDGKPRLIDAGYNGVNGSHADTASSNTSIVAVPLLVSDRVRGMIYAETSGTQSVLNEGHIGLLMALGSIAFTALDHARREELLNAVRQDPGSSIVCDGKVTGDFEGSSGLGLGSEPLLGRSASMLKLRHLISRIGQSECTVLIQGESGTGKELAARAIHLASPRASKPLVAINCAALTETLLESELFGHERGAFTGALATKQGKIELAEGGTLLLDEIGTMPRALQAKLLRVLEDRQFERLGGIRPICVDFRLLAATNADLEAEVQRESFRVDLYHRLKVVSLVMPPLRDRKEDIGLLAERFAHGFAKKAGRGHAGFSAAAVELLERYNWPGNVRELRNAVEHAMVMSSSEIIRECDLPEALRRQASEGPPNFKNATDEAKKSIIRRAFIQAWGCHAEAARALGMNPTYFSRLVHKLDLKAELEKSMGPRLWRGAAAPHGSAQ